MGELRTQLYRSSRITKQVFESKLFTRHKQTENQYLSLLNWKQKQSIRRSGKKFKKVIPQSLSNKTC